MLESVRTASRPSHVQVVKPSGMLRPFLHKPQAGIPALNASVSDLPQSIPGSSANEALPLQQSKLQHIRHFRRVRLASKAVRLWHGKESCWVPWPCETGAAKPSRCIQLASVPCAWTSHQFENWHLPSFQLVCAPPLHLQWKLLHCKGRSWHPGNWRYCDWGIRLGLQEIQRRQHIPAEWGRKNSPQADNWHGGESGRLLHCSIPLQR